MENYITRVLNVSATEFDPLALEIFRFQYENNILYRAFCDHLSVNPSRITSLKQIPFLPISFFKTHNIQTSFFTPEVIYESSGTTGVITSRHLVKSRNIYVQSFLKCFKRFYGEPSSYCIIGLLPSYLERQSSSLVTMVNELIKLSNNERSGFYLSDTKKLHNTLLKNEDDGRPTLLIGVTFALIDFAEHFPMNLKHTIIMETGGMKGRRAEITRTEVHELLKKQFGIHQVHSEYGMTELLSQAYSPGDGIFETPPWMRIFLRATDDPFDLKVTNGAVNIIDLANIYSCAFIATDDTGILQQDGRFNITGRLDNSDIRGCALMAL